jgi:outer membrane protein OmpA-like peptidoglycan-associated protein
VDKGKEGLMKGKFLPLLIVIAAFMIVGCSSKGYVDEQMAAFRSEIESDMNTLKAQSGTNADEIKKLQTLTTELSSKADMALNEAKGFENYQVIWEGVVNFDFDSYELKQVAMDNLQGLGQKMIDYPRSLLEISGHADQTGSAKYNLELGFKRSQAVQKYLVDQFGIALYRMFMVSHGESKPVALPDEKDANAKNRRVTLKLWGRL